MRFYAISRCFFLNAISQVFFMRFRAFYFILGCVFMRFRAFFHVLVGSNNGEI